MKGAIAICFLALASAALARPEEGKYTNRYDNTNLDEILQNDKLLESYVLCILDKGRCTPEGKEMKGNMKEGLETNCAKCTEAQRNGTTKVITYLINFKPIYWKQLTDKYDPTRKYAAKYEQDLKKAKHN